MYIYKCMDRELKTEDINIRIEKSKKNKFKQKCLNENKTMSEMIIEFINQKNK